MGWVADSSCSGLNGGEAVPGLQSSEALTVTGRSAFTMFHVVVGRPQSVLSFAQRLQVFTRIPSHWVCLNAPQKLAAGFSPRE